MTDHTNVLGTLTGAVGQAGAARVFGTPVHQDGVVVLPVAKIAGGGGGGDGASPAGDGGEAGGGGGGFGLSATPAGVYVLRDGRVRWKPAVDVNRIVLGGQLVAVVALLVLRGIVAPRRRSRR